MENQKKYKTEKLTIPRYWYQLDQAALIDAMRSNIAAKEVIWDSLIRDNMELEQAIHDLADAWYSHQGTDYDAGEALKETLDKALKLVNRKGGITCGG